MRELSHDRQGADDIVSDDLSEALFLHVLNLMHVNSHAHVNKSYKVLLELFSKGLSNDGPNAFINRDGFDQVDELSFEGVFLESLDVFEDYFIPSLPELRPLIGLLEYALRPALL